jgi:hypothetical protein
VRPLVLESDLAHPFFDVVIYPWSREDARALHKALFTTINKFESIDLLYKSCGADLPPLAQDSADVVWKSALEKLVAVQHLRELGSRLSEAIQYAAARKAFDALAAAVDPLQEPGLVSDRVFVDRSKLRETVGKLTRSDAAITVLLVRGAPCSGKSWTRHVVAEQAKTLGQGCTYLCADLVGTAEEALDLIFAELGGKVPDKHTTEDAWFRKACSDMIALASKRKVGSWIVADDLGIGRDGPLLDPKIRQLFNQIALSMLNPAFAQWFRLVLIDYPEGPVPTKWKGFWEEDRPAAADAQADSVAEYLRRWATQKKKALAVDEANRLAGDILAKADTPDPTDTRPRLERVHDGLKAVLERL